MRIKPNLRVVWGLVSLESSHPSPQSSWRADRLGPRMGVRSQNFPGDSALPWVFSGEPCALVSRLEPDFQPTVLCILLWTAGLCLQRNGPVRCPTLPDSEDPDSLQVPHPKHRDRSCPFFPHEGSLPAGRFRHLLIPTGCPHHVLSVFKSAGD